MDLDPKIILIRNNASLDREQKIDAVINLLASKGSKVPGNLASQSQAGAEALATLRRGPNGELQLVALEPEASRALIARTYLE
jgi:hypothetical protein